MKSWFCMNDSFRTLISGWPVLAAAVTAILDLSGENVAWLSIVQDFTRNFVISGNGSNFIFLPMPYLTRSSKIFRNWEHHVCDFNVLCCKLTTSNSLGIDSMFRSSSFRNIF